MRLMVCSGGACAAMAFQSSLGTMAVPAPPLHGCVFILGGTTSWDADLEAGKKYEGKKSDSETKITVAPLL